MRRVKKIEENPEKTGPKFMQKVININNMVCFTIESECQYLDAKISI